MKRTPLFKLGRIVATPGALAAIERHPVDLFKLLARHQSGDWGVCCAEDMQSNDHAAAHGERVVSAYPIDPAQPSEGWGQNTLWIITERDRSVTTVLLPDEY